MQLTIDTQNKNPLLERTDVTGNIVFEGLTPSNNEVTAAVAEKVGSKEELVVMKNIYTKFSRQEADFSAAVYSSTEARAKAEKMTKHLRKQQEVAQKKAEEDKKAAEEAAAKAQEEAKVAETKPVEEAPVEKESPTQPAEAEKTEEAGEQ